MMLSDAHDERPPGPGPGRAKVEVVKQIEVSSRNIIKNNQNDSHVTQAGEARKGFGLR